jgi:uncharacterized protein (TIGR02996 family)
VTVVDGYDVEFAGTLRHGVQSNDYPAYPIGFRGRAGLRGGSDEPWGLPPRLGATVGVNPRLVEAGAAGQGAAVTQPDGPEWEALLRAVAASPADDVPRLVAADWLDDHGQPDRAEFVRAQVELAALEAADDGQTPRARLLRGGSGCFWARGRTPARFGRPRRARSSSGSGSGTTPPTRSVGSGWSGPTG